MLDPHAAFLIQRGLKTYFVRYREQTRAAQLIAEHLAAHPAVARVHYPGLPGHPQAALAKKQMREAGTVVSFDLKQGSEAARSFSEKLKLFALTASLGSTESLVMPPQLVGSRDFTAEQARHLGCRAGHRAAVDRPGGHRRSDRGHRPGVEVGRVKVFVVRWPIRLDFSS